MGLELRIVMNTLPIENCYWVVPGKLLAGEYPRDKGDKSSRVKINALLRAGIKSFIDLTEENEGLLPYSDLIGEASHQRFPIRDISIPSSPGFTKSVLDAIDSNIRKDKMTYVHCWGGVGRTGLIIGCWLARHKEGGKSALIRLRELWRQCPKSYHRRTPETPEQEQYVLGCRKGL